MKREGWEIEVIKQSRAFLEELQRYPRHTELDLEGERYDTGSQMECLGSGLRAEAE